MYPLIDSPPRVTGPTDTSASSRPGTSVPGQGRPAPRSYDRGVNTVAAALTFVWLGMVLAISFLEAPIKFRAPGITVPLGVGIGRLVFRALNGCEAVLAVGVALALAVGPHHPVTVVLTVLVALDLLACIALRRVMDRRVIGDAATRAISEEMPRHNLHFAYIGLEVAKVGLLIALGVAALS